MCSLAHGIWELFMMRRHPNRQTLSLRYATAALALALTAFGAGAAPATPGDILFVEAGEATLRAAPEAAAPVVLRLEAGRKLIEFERRDAWFRVGVFGAVGKVGWIRRDLTAAREPESAGPDLIEVVRGPEVGREPDNARLDLPEVIRGPGAARPDPARHPAPPTTVDPTGVFRLVVTGSTALKYAGHCDLIGADGRSRRRKIAGLVRNEIEFPATAILCRVGKQDFRGRLRVALRHAGRLVAKADTAAPFNHVVIRSAGPWGVADGSRGAVITRRSKHRPRPRHRLLPPLTIPIIPAHTIPIVTALTGHMIPPLMGPTTRPPRRTRRAARFK